MENSNSFSNSIKDKIALYFDNALNDVDRKELLNHVNSDPSFNKMFEKEKHVRNMIKTHIKRPAATNDLIQNIRNKVKIN